MACCSKNILSVFRLHLLKSRPLILLASSSLLSFALYFESCFICLSGFLLVYFFFFVFHAECFYFWLLHTSNSSRTRLNVKNGFANLLVVFPFSSKTALQQSIRGFAPFCIKLQLKGQVQYQKNLLQRISVASSSTDMC